MIRNGLLAGLVALGLSTTAWAGELDRERTGTAKATITGAGDVLGVTAAASEMDRESPAQACWSCGPRWRSSSLYVSNYGGWNGGWSSSYYAPGWGGGWNGGWTSSYPTWNAGWNGGWNSSCYSPGWNAGWNGGWTSSYPTWGVSRSFYYRGW